MNLLPKSHVEFSQKEYWDSFFKQRGNKTFEWYGEYPELAEHLHKYIKLQDDVLITGCGNSTIGRDLYDIGYSKITNIDISHVVIRQMLSQNKEKDRPNLKYLQMDALETSFDNEQFNVVLDKGTLDALMPDNNPETVERIIKYFNEIQRLLKIGGRYICISLLQEQILKIVLDYFPKHNNMFRVVRCYEAEIKAADNNENSMPVFIIICTKFKSLHRPILELNLTSSNKMQRFETIDQIIEQITSVQHAAFVCSGLKRCSIDQENEVSFDLFKSGNLQSRYTVYVLDGKFSHKNIQYAAFIVPQGRETEWLFSTKSGRQKLLKSTNTNRLAIVTMHREQEYGSLKEIQEELSDAICSLAPSDLKNKKIPFLSLGADEGKRIVRFKGNSRLSGDYVIEDVEVDGETFRRLFYMSSQLVIQSEAKLKTKNKTKKQGNKDVVNLTYLTCKHHIWMSIATHLACQQKKSHKIAVIGLGGGGLCSFLRKFLPKTHLTAIDIDEDMLNVATNWFGLVQDNNLTVRIEDGIEFLNNCVKKNEQFDAVLFDVDSKDSTIGMSCPPKHFLHYSVLDNISNIISTTGFFVLNLVLRDETLKPEIVASLKSKFEIVISYKVDEDLNEIFICSNINENFDNVKLQLKKAAQDFNLFLKTTQGNHNIEVEEFIKQLKIYK